MFTSPFLTFDVDNERDAIYKARSFVEQVSQPLTNLPTPIIASPPPRATITDVDEPDNLAESVQLIEEEEKKEAMYSCELQKSQS